MQKITGLTHTVLRPDAIILGAAALLTMAMLACGDSKGADTRSVEAAPIPSAPPVEVRESTPVELPAPPRVVTYADAERTYGERRYGEAAEMFTQYVVDRPKNPFGHYMLGLSAWKSGQPERAESAFVQAIELDPAHVKSHLNLARVLLDLGRGDEALERVTTALELDSSNVDVHRLMGRVLTTVGRPAGAMESYRVALSIDSTDSWSMNNLGLLLIRQGRFEEALGPLARAVELQPSVAVFQNNLGVALERTGRFGESVVAYQSAIDAEGGHPTATTSLERVSQLKEKPDALFVSLETLAATFAAEVRGWHAEREGTTEVESAGIVIRD